MVVIRIIRERNVVGCKLVAMIVDCEEEQDRSLLNDLLCLVLVLKSVFLCFFFV